MPQTKTFEYTWPTSGSGTTWYKNGFPEDARRYFWEEYQEMLMSKIRKELEDGWTPISEVGPSAITMRESRKQRIDPIATVLTLGIDAAFSILGGDKDVYRYPSAFRVLMKKDR
jgi:hypothetical protein